MTIEAALKELREMFPRRTLYLERKDYFRLSDDGRDDVKIPKVKLTIPEIQYKYGPPLVIETYTLDEAMARARKAHQEQS